jgi:hypothetical protein
MASDLPWDKESPATPLINHVPLEAAQVRMEGREGSGCKEGEGSSDTRLHIDFGFKQ